jgi:DNA polymerase III subunit alpha
MISENHGIDLDPEEVPLEDVKTYELFQRGETVAIFQYESAGMQKYMKELVPTTFEDLIAMNALYRPGPLEYIPEFIERKHGRKPVVYDLAAMEEFLHETYGVCVSGDTLVYDATKGRRVRIDQLEEEVGQFFVQGVDEQYEYQRAKVTHWVCNGVKKVIEVKLRCGSSIKLTPDHKVLTEKGWVAIGSLEVGDFIATPRLLNVSQEQNFDRGKLRVLAYILADGSLSSMPATADFVSKDTNLIKAYKDALLSFENLEIKTLQQVRDVTRVMVKGTNKTHYHETNSLVKQLREWKLKTQTGGCRSDEKFVPEFVFGLSKEDIAFFLASLWDCDGYIGGKVCHFKTISPFLAENVRTLLLRLGLHSTTYESKYQNNRRGKEMTAYQVSVYDTEAFAYWIEPHLVMKSIPSEQFNGLISKDTIDREIFIQELQTAWAGSARGLMEVHGFDRQHLQRQRRLKNPRIAMGVVKPLLQKISLPNTSKNANIRWEEIVEINIAREELVYDITVEGIHNFVANNIIVHNCVYQEQVMLLSQKLAGFSKGQADVLRKAMGKKQKAVLDSMHPKFLEGGQERGHPEDILNKVWKDWEAFASYAFNKSHSTCYAFVAFQTAYLKAHYPAEFMASVLTHNKSNLDSVTFFLSECRRMNLDVLGPDVNESLSDFSVNKEGQIRFGLSALKGVGEGPVEAILEERRKNGPFRSIFDLMQRLPAQAINKRVMESLAYGGAFDCYPQLHRAQYFAPSDKYDSFIEHLTKYGSAYQSEKSMAANSLFGDTGEIMIPEPLPPQCEPWSLPEKLDKEKDVTGIFISGHPLDDYRLEIDNFITCTLDQIEAHQQKPQLQLAGMVTRAVHRVSKNGNGWGIFEIRDYNAGIEFKLFGEDYQRFKHLLEDGKALFIKGAFQKGWNSEESEFKPKEVKLLEGVGADLTQSITLQLPVERLSAEMIDRLEAACKRYKGPHRLRIELIDAAQRLRVPAYAKERKVMAAAGFIEELEKMKVEYRLN